jgi:hypothetical protein
LDEDGETSTGEDCTLVLGRTDDLQEFDGHVLRLLQMMAGDVSLSLTNKAQPERFAKSSVPAAELSRLAAFLAEVAAAVAPAMEACPNGHPAATPISEEEATAKTWKRKKA